MKVYLKNFGLFILALICLIGCATAPPRNTQNVCNMFRENPKWYQASQRSQKKWGVPISIMMAVIYQESGFSSEAKPPPGKMFGFIPLFRPTSAFGYCQATDDSWRWYKRQIGDYSANRNSFATAIDFIGFYAEQANLKAGISKNDPYNIYLAYHEGIKGYLRKTYVRKRWLISVAHKVENRALMYHHQLMNCFKRES